jgi:hypothetical protein
MCVGAIEAVVVVYAFGFRFERTMVFDGGSALRSVRALMVSYAISLRPFLQHPCLLPDRQFGPWPALDSGANSSRALSRLLPAYNRRSTLVPSRVHFSTL